MKNDLFETASVPKAYFSLALPVVLSMIVSLVYNMVDTWFIAKTQNTALIAGVSLCAPVFTMMIALGDIMGLGGSSVISRLFGQKMNLQARQLSSFCHFASILLGVLAGIIMLVFRSPLLALLGADPETFTYASSYYSILALGAPAIVFSLAPSNLMRTEAAATQSMAGSVLGAVVNMILDPVFIFVLGYGAAGAAIATVIGYLCSDAYFIWYLRHRSSQLSIRPQDFHISAESFRSILSIGIPASITNLMQSIALALTNHFLLRYGTEQIAAMGIAMKLNMIAVLILVGFSFGSQPLMGYCFGAGNQKRLHEVMKFSYLFEGLLAAVITAALSLPAPYLMRLFVRDSMLIESGSIILRLQLISMVFISITMVSTCLFQAEGRALDAFLLSVSRQGVIFIIVILITSHFAGYYGVLCAQPISDFLTAALAVFIYRKNPR